MLFPVFSSKYCRLLDSILALNWYILIFFQCRSKISDLEHTLTQVIKENQAEKENTSKKYERDMEKNKFVFHYFVGKKIQDIKGWVDLFEFPKIVTSFPLNVGGGLDLGHLQIKLLTSFVFWAESNVPLQIYARRYHSDLMVKR